MHPLCARVGLLAALVTSLAVPVAGCGLISSDVTNFDLTLPDKKFTIDTNGWQVDATKARPYLSLSCADDASVCSAAQNACTSGCSGTCDATRKTCDLSLDVSVVQPVNLLTEKPELKSINDEPVIKVSIDSVTYEVATNTLNVATPEIAVYVAPASIVKVNDPQAKAIGVIAPIPAGQKTTAPQPIQLTAAGKAELINIMSTFKTPFNVLVGTSLLIADGQPVPTGKLDAVVHINGHAGL